MTPTLLSIVQVLGYFVLLALTIKNLFMLRDILKMRNIGTKAPGIPKDSSTVTVESTNIPARKYLQRVVAMFTEEDKEISVAFLEYLRKTGIVHSSRLSVNVEPEKRTRIINRLSTLGYIKIVENQVGITERGLEWLNSMEKE